MPAIDESAAYKFYSNQASKVITPANILQMADVSQDRYKSQRYKRSQVPPEITSNDYGNRDSSEEDDVAIEEEKKHVGSRLRLSNSQGKAAFNSFVKGDDSDKNFIFSKDSIDKR